MTGFLDETGAVTAIQDMLSKADTATLAVAFWGSGAVDKLGLDKKWKSIRIVCNLDSGACNPDEIKRLMNLDNVDVRTDCRLHGKVYLTPDKLVMGSSNASSNGLVVEGASITGWAEANIESEDPGLIRQLSIWCDQRFSQALKVTTEQISLAKIAWNARKTFAPLGASLTSDLLKLVRMQPDHPAFSSIKVVQWAENESDHAQKAFADALSKDKSLTGTEFYEGWGTSMGVDDWLIDFDVRKGKPKHTGYWKVIYIDEESDLTFVRKYGAVSIPAIGELRVAERDLPALAESLTRSKPVELGLEGKIQHVTKLIKYMRTNVPLANDKAFDRAMFDIYDQAAVLGYRPTEFKSMVDRAGGVSTARQLLAKPAITSGFTRLWELQRLDLTVEALVLNSKWRSLFSYEELERARRRLAEFDYSVDD